MPDLYTTLEKNLAQSGADAALEVLANELRDSGRVRELFAVRQMQVRARLGLPIIDNGRLRDVVEPLRTQVEEGYVDACREAGQLLLAAGKLRDAWPYLNIVGDKPAVRAALETFAVTDDNANEFVELALYEGICPARGVEILLGSNGTCNTITTLDSTLHALPPADQAACVGLLVRRVHGDLLENLRYDIQRQSGSPAAETTITDLVADREWLFSEAAYHIDTSHLSATVRLAKVLLEHEDLRRAIDLTEYGRRLAPQFQFAAEEPFSDFYPSHGIFLRALCGDQIDAAANYFRDRAERVDVVEQGTSAIEFYVALLDRVGRATEALEESIRLLPPGSGHLGIAPPLSELAIRAGRLDRLAQVSRERNDPVGFAAGLLSANLK
jgi:hypothetical protein